MGHPTVSSSGNSGSVGFVGLGNMGAPMVRNLAAAGFDLIVHDLDTTKVEAVLARAAAEGHSVRAAASAVEAATDVALVFTSLPGPAQVCAVGDEIVPAMAPGSIWVDLSTSDLPTARHVAHLADRCGIDVLDAPVTGGIEGAEAGTLRVLVGGDAEVHRRAEPTLDAIGERYELIGAHGAGYVAKISQVILCYLNSVCLTEALLLGVKGGVDPAAMLDIVQTSTGRSYVADRYGPELLDGGYDDSFDLTLAAKDLRLAVELADEVGAVLDTTVGVRALYDRAEQRFGPTAPHLMALQEIEHANDLVLHRHDTTRPAQTEPERISS